jgi:hypothetical protein
MLLKFITNRWTRKPAHDLPLDLWMRDWEFLYRAADLLWAILGDRPDIFERRLKYLKPFGSTPTRCSDREAARYGVDFQPACAWITKRWCRLFDQWSESRGQFVFDDGFAVLFLLRLLWANDTLLLRGHYDARWKLISTRSRAQERGTDFLKNALERGQQFLEHLKRLPIVQSHYGSEMPKQHATAILQHYGFPTHLLDLTYSYDVALYFAEGGTDSLPLSRGTAALGAIYAFPPHALPHSAVLTTLPPIIMRPTLQRGVFVGALQTADEARLEKYKFIFRHKFLPIWNGITGVDFGSPVGLGRYLFPAADPIETLARPLQRAVNEDV